MERVELTKFPKLLETIHFAAQVEQGLRGADYPNEADSVAQAIKRARDDNFKIGILGLTKRGKSTLANAILGRRDDLAAPIGQQPATSVITEFRRSSTESVTVHFREPEGRKQTIAMSSIRDFVTEGKNPANKLQVKCVHVESSFPGLDEHAVLVDLPGADSMHGHHDDVLLGFMPEADAMIFVVTANAPLAEAECQLLREMNKAHVKRMLFVINTRKTDTAEDIAEGVSANLDTLATLGIHPGSFLQIDAKGAFEGDIEGSGLNALLEALRELLAEGSRVEIARTRLRAIAEAARDSKAGEVAYLLSTACKTDEEIRVENKELATREDLFKKDMQAARTRIGPDWRRAVNELDEEIMSAKSRVRTTVNAQIEDTSLFAVKNLATCLGSLVAAEAERECRPALERFEGKAAEFARRLEADLPAIIFTTSGETLVRTTSDGGAMKWGAIKGGTLMAAGAGVPVAAASMMASITSSAVASVSTWAWLNPFAWPSLLIGGVGGGAVTTSAGALVTTLAAPVAVVMFGIGALTIPLAWRASRITMRNNFIPAANEHIDRIFAAVQSEYVRPLRNRCDQIIDDYEAKKCGEIDEIRSKLAKMLTARPMPEEIAMLKAAASALNAASTEQGA